MKDSPMPHRDPFYEHALFWNILIALSLLTCIAAVYASVTFLSGPLAWIVTGIGSLGFCLIMYGTFIEPTIIILNKKSIQILALPAIKIALVADFHVGSHKRTAFVEKIVKRINAEHPDLIIVAGDFVFDHHADISNLEPLKELHAPMGVFAIMGNHDLGHHVTISGTKFSIRDRTNEITAMLRSFRWTVLRDESTVVEAHGKKFAIAGVDKSWKELMDTEAAFKNVPDDLPVILLSHNPDVILLDDHKRASLIVSGHTHGGQFRLPFIGPIAPIPSELGRKYDRGIFTLKNGTILAITQGVGETLARARLFCPPEIMILNINKN